MSNSNRQLPKKNFSPESKDRTKQERKDPLNKLPEDISLEIDRLLDDKSLNSLSKTAKGLFFEKKGAVEQRGIKRLLTLIVTGSDWPKMRSNLATSPASGGFHFQSDTPSTGLGGLGSNFGIGRRNLGNQNAAPELKNVKLEGKPNNEAIKMVESNPKLLTLKGDVDVRGYTITQVTPLELAYGICNTTLCKSIIDRLDQKETKEALDQLKQRFPAKKFVHPDLIKKREWKDYSGRVFFGTELQYAYATDNQGAVQSIINKYGNDQVAEALRHIKEGPVTIFTPANADELVQSIDDKPKKALLLKQFREKFDIKEIMNGKPFSFQPLLEALQAMKNNYNRWSKEQRDFFGIKIIGHLLNSVPHYHDHVISAIGNTLFKSEIEDVRFPMLSIAINMLETYKEKIDLELATIISDLELKSTKAYQSRGPD